MDNELDIGMDLGLNLEDLGLDDSSFLNVLDGIESEDVNVNHYMSEDSIEDAKDLVNYTLDRNLRILAMNRTISMILDTGNTNSLTRTKKKVKDFYKNKGVESEIRVQQLRETITEVTERMASFVEVKRDVVTAVRSNQEVSRPHDLLERVISTVVNRVSSYIDTNRLEEKLYQMQDDLLDPTTNLQSVWQIVSDVTDELITLTRTLEGLVVGDKEHIENEFNFISDNLKVEDLNRISEDQRFLVENLNVEKRIRFLKGLKDNLDREDIHNTDIPTIYRVEEVIINKEISKISHLSVVGGIVFSLDAESQSTKLLTHVDNSFINNFNILGLTNKLVKLSTGFSGNFLDLIYKEYSSLLEKYDLKEYPLLNQNIIEIMPIYVSTIDNTIFLIDPSSEEFSFKAFKDQVPVLPEKLEKTNLEMLEEFSSDREASDNHVFFTVLKADTNNSEFIKEELVNKANLKARWNLKYTKEDLGKIALQRNIEKLLSTSVSNLDLNIERALIGDSTYDAVLESTLARAQADTRLATQNRLALKLQLSFIDKLTYNNQLTYASNKIVNMFTDYMENQKGIITSRVYLEEIYYQNQESIHKEMAYSILSKAEHDLVQLREILGDNVDSDVYFENVSKGSEEALFNLNVNLESSDISNYLWVMSKLYSRGLEVSQVITKNDSLINIGARKYTPTEVVRLLVEECSKPTCLDDLWGHLPGKLSKNLSGSNSLYYKTVRKMLAQAYTICVFIKDNLQEVNSLYDIKNLTADETFNIDESNSEMAKKYGLEDKFYDSYRNKYLIKQINGVFKANNLKMEKEISLGKIADCYIEFLWETRNPDKDFSHQLANIPLKKLPSMKTIMNRNPDALGMITAMLDLRNKIGKDQDILEDYLRICNLKITRGNEHLSNIVNTCIYLMSVNTIYAYELYEYLTSVAIDSNLDHFGADNVKTFNSNKGFDGCKEEIENSHVLESLETDSNEGMLFAKRDSMLLTQMLSRKFARKYNRQDLNEEFLKDNNLTEENVIYNLMLEGIKNLTLERSMSKLTIKLNEIDAEELEYAINCIGASFPTEWDKIYVMQNLSEKISTTDTNAVYRLNNSNMLVKPGVDVNTLEAKIEEMKEKMNILMRRSDVLNILSDYISYTLIEDNRTEINELNDEINKIVDINYDKFENTVKLSERSIKKSIALYRQYLKTGDVEYLTEVDIDAVPFELLTSESSENQATGEYSKSYLKDVISIVNPKDEHSLATYFKMDFDEIFEIASEEEPNFFQDAPLAIKEYILDQDKFKRSIIMSNFK